MYGSPYRYPVFSPDDHRSDVDGAIPGPDDIERSLARYRDPEYYRTQELRYAVTRAVSQRASRMLGYKWWALNLMCQVLAERGEPLMNPLSPTFDRRIYPCPTRPTVSLRP
jgi:hypothetical protein